MKARRARTTKSIQTLMQLYCGKNTGRSSGGKYLLQNVGGQNAIVSCKCSSRGGVSSEAAAAAAVAAAVVA